MFTHLFGITGRAGSGKDTFCRMALEILTEHRVPAAKITIAAPLKDFCEDLFGKAYGVPPHAFSGSQAHKNMLLTQVSDGSYSGRRILRKLGAGCLRIICDSVLIDYAIAEAHHKRSQGTLAIFFSDVRFLNEAEIIRKHGGKIIRIQHPDADATIASDITEQEMASIEPDYVLNNQGRSLVELRERVKDLLCTLHFLPLTQRLQG